MSPKLKSLFILPLSVILILSMLLPGCAQTPVKTTIPPPKIEFVPIQPESQPNSESGLIRLPSSAVVVPLVAMGNTDKTAYAPGEEVKILFSLINNVSETVKISAFQPEITISPYSLLTKTESIRSIAAGPEKIEIPSKAKATYEVVWDQKHENGSLAEPGWYDVGYKVSYSLKTSLESINKQDSLIGRIVIKFPDGQAMNKVIDINQSVTVKGLPLRIGRVTDITDVTMTLKRIELNDEGIKISVLLSSPHYSLGPGGYWDVSHEWIRQPVAEYAIDGVKKPAGPQASNPLTEGMLLEWGKGTYNPLNPITKDSREFTFTILSYGDWQGPWRFTSPLK